MTIVIQTFVYPDLWHIHLLWATILLFILTRGPGAISLDHIIAKTLLQQHQPPARIGATVLSELGDPNRTFAELETSLYVWSE